MATSEVSIRELRNHGGDVVDRVAHGERVVITRSGSPVAELRPITAAPVPAATLLARWRRLPVVDPDRFRADVDAVLDADL
jgi:prevent-host-death family protein